ncbi:hypothetical protein QAD02_020903 [Eretmocerus hayati]|uniref:Uncharacterized protein n=1 Tax=Eretmocerus hayati TaxID=131215 RepID=A0ACC2PTJ2_9HYME|nr:hypothetical protein QAD02_020903 [Eretmocerus hayati]
METGIIRSKIRVGNEWLNLLSVYSSGDWSRLVTTLNKIEDSEEEKLVIGGDFNIRIGKLGKFLREGYDQEYLQRGSKDRVISNEVRYLVRMVEDEGWVILDGTADKDAQRNSPSSEEGELVL